MTDLLIFAVFIAALAVASLYRVAKGPRASDRLAAMDHTDLLVSCALMLFSLYSGRGIYLDIALITAMIGIVNTMLFGRYIDKRRWSQKDVDDKDN